jgi:hypothetical protein
MMDTPSVPITSWSIGSINLCWKWIMYLVCMDAKTSIYQSRAGIYRGSNSDLDEWMNAYDYPMMMSSTLISA